MVCSFIDTLRKYTTCIMRSSWCYWSAVNCDGRATCSWSRLTTLLLERLLGVLTLHWGTLFSEARWSHRVDLAGSHLSLRQPAPVAGCIVTCRTCRANMQTALVEMYMLTGPSHLADWNVFRSRSYFATDSQSVSMSWYRAPLWDLQPDIISCRNVAVCNLRPCICGAPSLTRGRVCNVYLCWCLDVDPSADAARNNSCIVAIVGYHEISVYRTAAWIPIGVTVTSVVIW
jgi:hypothetical protein